MRRGADASVHSTAHAIVPGTCFMGREIREQSQHEAKEKSCFVCLFMKLNYELRSSILHKHSCLPISSISCVDWNPASQPADPWPVQHVCVCTAVVCQPVGSIFDMAQLRGWEEGRPAQGTPVNAPCFRVISRNLSLE